MSSQSANVSQRHAMQTQPLAIEDWLFVERSMASALSCVAIDRCLCYKARCLPLEVVGYTDDGKGKVGQVTGDEKSFGLQRQKANPLVR